MNRGELFNFYIDQMCVVMSMTVDIVVTTLTTVGIPKNFFDVSYLSWVKCRSFDIQVFDEGKFLSRVVTLGKFEEECKDTVMPLTMNIHHAVADGFHL